MTRTRDSRTTWMFGMLVMASMGVATGCVADTADDGEEDAETSSALSANVLVETDFAEPSDKADHHILGRIEHMVDDTPSGGTIRIALFSIDDAGVIDALLRAKQKRNVDVRVIQNGEARGHAGSERLAKGLGKGHRFCGSGDRGGCISKAASSIMHSKVFLFSKTRDKKNTLRSDVVWFGSANMTHQTGAATYNNTVSVYGDERLYADFGSKYFDKLWAQDDDGASGQDYFDQAKGRGYFVSPASGTVVRASPTSADVDLVAARLHDVVPSPGCEIRISQNMIHAGRSAIYAELARIADPRAAQHCEVRVLVNQSDGTAKTLAGPHVKVRSSKTHDKLFLIDARYQCGTRCAGASRTKIVFTGSHNWTKSAEVTNDELLVRMIHPQVWAGFDGYFERQWKASRAL